MGSSQQTDNLIFGEDTTKLSKSPYLTSPLKKGQAFLISLSWLYSIIKIDFQNLKLEGVCNGLCLDYARHVVSHRNTNTRSDYIAKLKRKLTIFGKDSKNFIKRINMYQGEMQASEEDRVSIQDSSDIFNNNQFIKSLPASFINSSVIGLSFRGKKGGHIIAIQAIKNYRLELIGYKIFDPNIGEFDCSKSEIAAENIQHFNEVLKDIYEMYGVVGVIDCSVSDLEKKVKEYELVKLRDSSEYKSEYKYLDNNPNTQTIENKKLFDAVERGELEVVRSLLADKRTEINKPNANGATPLYIAAQNGYTEIVKLFVANAKTEVNSSKYNGVTALFIASQNGYTEIVSLLLSDSRTSDINKRRDDSYTGFYLAAQMGHTEIVKLFLADKRTEVNKTCEGTTSLYVAAQNGHTEIVRMLVNDKRTDINKECDGITPLDIATQNGHKEIVKILKTALLKEKILKTLKSAKISDLYAEIEGLSFFTQIELVEQIKISIKELAKENKGWSIKKIISIFPEDKRMEYFFDSARKAVLECAKHGNDKKVELILSAFPKQQDRDLILASSVLTPCYPLAKPSLIKQSIKRISESITNNFQISKGNSR